MCWRCIYLWQKKQKQTRRSILTMILISRIINYITSRIETIRSIPSCVVLWVVWNTSKYYNVVLTSKLNRSAVATSCQVGWVNCMFQDILGQKFCQYDAQKAKLRKNINIIRVWNSLTRFRLKGSLYSW